jgi:hypothetical protein
MKFMLDCLPSPTGVELTTEQVFALVRPEFANVGATVEFAALDIHPARFGADSPFEPRGHTDCILVVDIPSLPALADYAANTGRCVTMMAASAWSSADSGAITLTHRLILSYDCYSEREEQ